MADNRGPRRRTTTRWLAGILIAAGAARLVWIVLTIREPRGVFDPAFYFGSAMDIAHGDGYRRFGEATAYFPPAYSFVLGAVFWVVRHTPLPDDLPAAGLALNLVLGVASVALVYRLGARLFDRTVGLAGAALVAVCPSLVFYTGVFFSETLFVFLALAALVVLADHERALGRWPAARLVVFGLLVGVASLTRTIGLVMLVALVVAAWAGGAGPRAALGQGAIALAAALVTIAPWTVRNALVMDAVIPIATNTGPDLCIGHNPDATGAFLINVYCQGPQRGSPQDQEVASEHSGFREAWRFARGHPTREIELLWHRGRYTFESDSESLDAIEAYGEDRFIRRDLRDALATLANLYFFAVAGLGLLGLSVLARRRADRLLVLLTLAGFALTPLAFFGNTRFHVPAIPLLALSAAALLTHGARRLGARREARASATAPGPAG